MERAILKMWKLIKTTRKWKDELLSGKSLSKKNPFCYVDDKLLLQYNRITICNSKCGNGIEIVYIWHHKTVATNIISGCFPADQVLTLNCTKGYLEVTID